MENDRVKADTVEEAEVDCELVNVVKADLDDGDLCGVGGVGGGGEDAEVALYFALCANRVEQAGDRILAVE